MQTPAQIAAELYPAINARNYDSFIAHYAPVVDYRDPDAVASTADELLTVLRWQIASFPDTHMTVKRITGDDRVAVTELECVATFQNDMAMPDGSVFKANGKSFAFALVEIVEVEAGKIVRQRCYWDNLDVYTQLGLIPEAVLA